MSEIQPTASPYAAALGALEAAEARLAAARGARDTAAAALNDARTKLETLQSTRQTLIDAMADGQGDLPRLRKQDGELVAARAAVDSAAEVADRLASRVSDAECAVFAAEQGARSALQTEWSARRDDLLREGVRIAAAALRPAWQAQDLGGVGMGADAFVRWIAADLGRAILAAPDMPGDLPFTPPWSAGLTDDQRRAVEDTLRAERLKAAA